jgi:hypothetical protein
MLEKYVSHVPCNHILVAFDQNGNKKNVLGVDETKKIKVYVVQGGKTVLSTTGLEPATYRLEVCRATFAPRRNFFTVVS